VTIGIDCKSRNQALGGRHRSRCRLAVLHRRANALSELRESGFDLYGSILSPKFATRKHAASEENDCDSDEEEQAGGASTRAENQEPISGRKGPGQEQHAQNCGQQTMHATEGVNICTRGFQSFYQSAAVSGSVEDGGYTFVLGHRRIS
jgi:hypothetical protein